jgi:rhamnogalacturonan endolyase
MRSRTEAELADLETRGLPSRAQDSSAPRGSAPLLGRWFLALVALLCFAAFPLPAANDPGGGTSGGGPNVTFTDNGSSVTLANGTLTAQITKSNAKVTSLLYRGRQMVVGDIYFSMDGSASYEQPGGGVFYAKTNTADMVDAGFRCTMKTHHFFDLEIHYVLRRGDTGLYVYSVLSHATNHPATSYGEWRMVWKMNQDQTERIYVDDLRNWQKPSSYDLANAEPTGIAEIIKLTTGPWAGRYDCKYMYNVEYERIGCYGHASNSNKIGAWMVFGGFDYFNDGPLKSDLAPATGINHVHFGRNHYNGSGLSLATNEVWSKLYGPYLLYFNTNSLGADACWADAKAQVDAEKSAWPYAWLTGETNYPSASQRGAVGGTLVFTDTLKSGVNAAGAWVGLVEPGVALWQAESKTYQYWARADTNGSFVIPHVRPGSYTLHAFNDGAVGEFSQPGITVTASTTNALGTLTWNVPHAGGYLAWEVGVPDRLPTEFRHGTNYWEPYIWDSFANEFSDPLEYQLDSANPAWDWNYAHNFYGTNVAVWDWNLRFTLPVEPPNSNARLTIATAGGESAHLYVYVNGSKRGDFYPPNAGGNTLLRQGMHDKYGVAYVTFNASTFLNAGTNVITLQQVNASPASGNCTMYDYVALEMPGTAPAVQFLTWTGGAASNRWDAGTISNWYAYGRTRTYANGQKVLFNDSGSNTPIRLSGTLTPASVVVNTAGDCVFSGTGSLAGSMTLWKKGPGTLTLAATNTYTGDTSIENGTVRVSTVEPAALVNGGFERPLLAPGTYTTPNDGPWRFGQTPGQPQGSAGIASGASVWSPTVAEGGQYGYFWRSGMAAQDVFLPAGSYTLSFQLVGRKASSGTTYTPADVAFQVVQAGVTNTVATWASATQTYTWAARTATFTVTNSGLCTLAIAASRPANNPADWGSDIDDVRLAFNSVGLLAAGLSDSSRLVMGTNGFLDLNGFSETIGPLANLNGAGGLVTNGGNAPVTLTIHVASGSNQFSGLIADRPGAALSLVKSGAGTQGLTGATTWSGDTTVAAGTLALAGQASLKSTPNLTLSPGAKLDARGLVGGLVLVSGQTLKGGGTIEGQCTVGAGATLAPGASIGALTFSHALKLAGSTVMEISKSPKTNDAVQVGGALTYGGNLIVTNLAGTLAAGDNFQFFSAPSRAGTFVSLHLPPLTTGLAWKTTQLAVDGRLWVVSTHAPTLLPPSLAGAGFVLAGTNGTPGWPCYVLASTNVAAPRSEWIRIATNTFNAGGGFACTNRLSPGVVQQFLMLEVP